MRPLRSLSILSGRKFSSLHLLLLAGVLIQIALSLGTSLRELNAVLGNLGASALWRGANFSQGARIANYIRFLNTNIPVEGRVVLPPAGFGPKALTTTPYMQFFLAPRQVINCTDLDCAQNLSTENTYLLVVEDFPGEEAAGRYEQRLMFNDRWGLLRPVSVSPGQPVHPGFERLVDILLAACLPLLWLGALAIGGYLLVRSLAPNLPASMQVGLGYGLSLSLLTAGLSLGWLLGLPLSTTTILGMTALLLIAGALLYGFRRRGALAIPQPKPSVRSLPSVWELVILLLTAVAVVLSVGQAYSVSDEIVLWGAKGYGIAASGSLEHVQDWGTNTVLYPLHVPILIAAFKTLFGESLPASKLVFPGYYLALVIFSYEFLRFGSTHWAVFLPAERRGLATNRRSSIETRPTAVEAAGTAPLPGKLGYALSSTDAISSGFILLLAASPLVFRHATIAYANLPFTFTLVGGVALLSLAIQGGPLRLYLLSGLMLAVAAWTRPEGLALAVLCILALLGVAFIQRRRLLTLRALVALVAPLACYGIFWIFLKAAAYTQLAGRGDLLGNALVSLSAGQWHLGEAGYILRTLVVSLVDLTEWGAWGIALLVLVGVYLWKGRPRHPGASALLLAGITCLGAILGMYYLTSYDTNHDISWWLSTGLERMLLPAVWLIWLGLGLGLQPLDDGEDRPVPAGSEDDRRLRIKL